MSLVDPIGDMLTRIRNGQTTNKKNRKRNQRGQNRERIKWQRLAQFKEI